MFFEWVFWNLVIFRIDIGFISGRYEILVLAWEFQSSKSWWVLWLNVGDYGEKNCKLSIFNLQPDWWWGGRRWHWVLFCAMYSNSKIARYGKQPDHFWYIKICNRKLIEKKKVPE